MTPNDLRRHLPKNVQEKTSVAMVKVWLCILLHVVEKGQTSRYDDGLRKRITDSTGEWISDSALKTCLKKMSDAGLLQNHRVICRYSEAGRAMLPLFGTFFASDGPPAGAHAVYTLPGLVPCFDRKTETDKGTQNAKPSALPKVDLAEPSDNSERSEGPPSVG